MTFSSILCFAVVCALVSRCTAATQFNEEFRAALEDALIEGGCSDCLRPTTCSSSGLTTFSAGAIRCSGAGNVVNLQINATKGSAEFIANLTSLDTSSFLVGDTGGVTFLVESNPQLATLNISAATSLNL